MSATIGIDLGGTKVAAALVDAGGRVLAAGVFPTNPEQGPEGIITGVAARVLDMLGAAGCSAEGVGIGVPGQVDDATGAVRFAPNLDWRDVPLREALQARLGLPVTVTNDVRAATWGEWEHGTGRGARDLMAIFVGTGVGGGIVADGRLLTGCTNTAGEVGHMTIVTGGRPCRCRNHGCLEAYAGGWAIAERAREAVLAEPEAGRQLLALAQGGEVTAGVVSEAFHQHDPLAARLVHQTGQYLAAGIVTLVNALNPCLLILGGGVIEGLPELVPVVEASVRARALAAAVTGLRITRPALGPQAGVIGAAAMARRRPAGAS
jgi:glucokinase